MDKVLAFSILSASPADIAAGSWARHCSRGRQQDDQPVEAEQQHQQQLLEKGKSQSQSQSSAARRPRFAPEFDGIDCFETIVWGR